MLKINKNSSIRLRSELISNKELAGSEKDFEKLKNFLLKLGKMKMGVFLDKNMSICEIIEEICTYLESILSAVPGSVYWLDKNNKYLGCNNEHCQWVGMSREDIIGKTNENLCWRKSAQALNAINNKVMQTGKSITLEESGKIVSGEYKTVLTRKSPLLTNGGKTIGIIGTSIDITDRKRAAKLQAEKETIEKFAKTMEMISGFIAHEMKTPLAIINLHNDLLGLDLNKSGLTFDSKEMRDKIADYQEKINSPSVVLITLLPCC